MALISSRRCSEAWASLSSRAGTISSSKRLATSTLSCDIERRLAAPGRSESGASGLTKEEAKAIVVDRAHDDRGARLGDTVSLWLTSCCAVLFKAPPI